MTTQMPTLVLLDCQRDQVEGPDGRIDPENLDVIRKAATLLQHARAAGWTVCHSHFAGDNTPEDRAPIPRLRPNTREAVFLRRGLSAFSDSYFHQVLARSAGAPCLLAGFSAPFSMLATVFDAQTRGHELTVIPEAVGSLAVEPRSLSDTRSVAFDLIGRISPVASWTEVETRWLAEPVAAG